MNRCPDLVVCLKRDLQCLRPEASLVLIYRPNVAAMKGRVDLAQPVKRAPDLWFSGILGSESVIQPDLSDNTGLPVPSLLYLSSFDAVVMTNICDRPLPI
ncbi:hypothetical protein TNCV_4488651 [Trichonephila clavipes]|nr:hypothetical protein TNCV_4488651 [Trichonephila clavipes]